MLKRTSLSSNVLIVLILTLGSFSLGIAEFTSSLLMPQIAQDIKSEQVLVGSAFSFYALGVLIGSTTLPFLGYKISQQRFFSLLLVWCLLGNLATSFVQTWEQLRWARLFGGMPHGVYLGLAAVVFTQVLPQPKRGTAIGILLAGIGLAMFLIVPLATYLREAQDWRIIFRAIALLDLLIIILLHDLVPDLPPKLTETAQTQTDVFKQPMLWWIFALSATAIAGRMAIVAYTEPIINHVSMLSSSHLPWIFTTVGLGTTISFAVGGYFADVNPQKTLFYALIWCLLTVTIFHFIETNAIGAYVGFFLLSTFVVMVPSLQLLSIEFSPSCNTLASCLNHGAMNIGNATGPFLSGLLLSAGWGWFAVNWVAWGMSFMALLIFICGHQYWLKPKHAPLKQR